MEGELHAIPRKWNAFIFRKQHKETNKQETVVGSICMFIGYYRKQKNNSHLAWAVATTRSHAHASLKIMRVLWTLIICFLRPLILHFSPWKLYLFANLGCWPVQYILFLPKKLFSWSFGVSWIFLVCKLYRRSFLPRLILIKKTKQKKMTIICLTECKKVCMLRMLDLDSCVALKPEQDLVLMNLLSKSCSQVARWGGQFQGWGSNSTNSMEEETFWWKGGQLTVG